MNVFVICTVRLGEAPEAIEYVNELEKAGHKVVYPPRDTEQNDDTGFSICTQNRAGIENADEVHVFYDACSQGIHFDLGMSFALRKKIKIVKILRRVNPMYASVEEGNEKTKSFATMLEYWEGQCV